MKEKELIELARKAIESYFSGDLEISQHIKKTYSEKQGVFVTIYKSKRLRGCIGFPYPSHKLYDAIVHAAKAAAFEDPRFPPIERDELDKIKIEISVLTQPKKLDMVPKDYIKHIKVGKDGLIVKYSMYSGLLLPQVATENRWNAKEFLRRTCEKAGLDFDQWQNPECEVFTFQADIVKE